MESSVQKICCVCSLDVSGLRRVKDPRGNYYCRPCYDTLLEAHRRRIAARAQSDANEPPATNASPNDASDVVPAVVSAVPAVMEAEPIPEQVISEQVIVVEPIEQSPALAAAPAFRITALPASGDEQAASAERAFSLGRALSKAASALAVLRPAPEPAAPTGVPVTARRIKRHIPRNALRLSDLVSEEAHEAVEAARTHANPFEPEIPVSPITNFPVSAFVQDYAALVEPREPVPTHAAPDDSDDEPPHDARYAQFMMPSAAAS